MTTLWTWRHPRAIGAQGRCIGQTDLPVDPRKAKRLAHRIRAAARRHELPREVWTSPLARCRNVGAWLKRWGWEHHIDARLMELDFGRWDGLPWTQIAPAEVAQWEADFMHHAPGGGEALAELVLRIESFVEAMSSRAKRQTNALLVSHAGWMQACTQFQNRLNNLGSTPPASASTWPAPPRPATLWKVEVGR